MPRLLATSHQTPSRSSPRAAVVLVTVAASLVGWPRSRCCGACVCNSIPYVGFVIGLVPPALLALLDQGWQTMLLVIIVYILLYSLLTSLIAPHYLGDAVGVSTPVTVIGLVFWGWVLGPLGAILSVPITSLVKVLLIDSDPRARWAAALIGPPGSMSADLDARQKT